MRAFHAFRLTLVSLVVAVQLTGMAHAERRIALVVGNRDYGNIAPAATAVNDANLIADVLKQDGFEVTLAANLGRAAFAGALQAFGAEADKADWAVVFYAGQAMDEAGATYVIPTDAKPAADGDGRSEAIPLDQMLAAVKGARSLRVVILAASFAGAANDTGRLVAKNEVRPSFDEVVEGTVIAFATRPGAPAAETGGANSPYATALAKHLAEPKLEIGTLFRVVRDDVLKETGMQQEPFFFGSLPARDYYFRP
jgi:uncharacterized caspase-like protein